MHSVAKRARRNLFIARSWRVRQPGCDPNAFYLVIGPCVLRIRQPAFERLAQGIGIGPTHASEPVAGLVRTQQLDFYPNMPNSPTPQQSIWATPSI